MIMFNFHHSLPAPVKQRRNCSGVGTSALGCEFINKCFISICLCFLVNYSSDSNSVLSTFTPCNCYRGCNPLDLFNNKQKGVNGTEIGFMPNPGKILLSSVFFLRKSQYFRKKKLPATTGKMNLEMLFKHSGTGIGVLKGLCVIEDWWVQPRA